MLSWILPEAYQLRLGIPIRFQISRRSHYLATFLKTDGLTIYPQECYPNWYQAHTIQKFCQQGSLITGTGRYTQLHENAGSNKYNGSCHNIGPCVKISILRVEFKHSNRMNVRKTYPNKPKYDYRNFKHIPVLSNLSVSKIFNNKYLTIREKYRTSPLYFPENLLSVPGNRAGSCCTVCGWIDCV